MKNICFNTHYVAAVKLWELGRRREAADQYWQSFQKIPSLTHELRYYILHGYTSILREQYFEATDEDLSKIRKVVDDKHEPRLFRIECGFTLGYLLYIKGKRTECAEAYYQALSVGEKKVKAKEAKMESKLIQFNMEKLSSKEIMGRILKDVQGNLDNLNRKTASSDGAFIPDKRADGTYISKPSKCHKMPIGPLGTNLNDEQFNKLIDVGGLECDCCKRNNVKLLKCQRCNKAFYCSAECQKIQWKEKGHRQHCRKEGEFKPKDLVQLSGLKAKPELNDTVVRIVGPAPTEGRYEVCMEGGDRSFSVSAANIIHLRPFDITAA